MLTYAAHKFDPITISDENPVARGPAIGKFERALADYVGADHAVAVNSGTTALYLAVRSLCQKGSRIALPSITFCGTANAIVCAGSTPVFADVGADGNILPEWLLAHDDEWDAVIPVHYAGNPCDLATISEIADKRPVILDACHALGVESLMDYADAACFSFHPAKQLTTGEGGAILVENDQTANNLRILRNNGIVPITIDGIRQNSWRGHSLNYWMSDIQAELGHSQLERLPDRILQRLDFACTYYEELPDWCAPAVASARREYCSWCMFPVLLDLKRLPITRYRLMAEMALRGVETQIHYHPLHRQPAGSSPPPLPGAEDFGERTLTLPLHNRMSTEDVLRVCAALKEVHHG